MSLKKQAKHYFTRVRQSYFSPKLNSVEIDYVIENMKPELKEIFFAQPMCDQRHGFLVFDRCKELFDEEDGISEEDLFLASLLHDVGKTESFRSVTLRILTALFIGFYGREKSIKLENSKFIFLQKVYAYADHSQIGCALLEEYAASEFVIEATKFHHSADETIDKYCQYPEQVKKFNDADNL